MTFGNNIRRLPYLIYAAAALFFVWGLINAWTTMANFGEYPDPSLEGVFALQKSQALYQAALEAIWLVTYGAILHVMIAIYDKVGGAKE